MKLLFYSMAAWSIGKIEFEVSQYFPSHWEIETYSFSKPYESYFFQEKQSNGFLFCASGTSVTYLAHLYKIPFEKIIYIVYDENELLNTIKHLEKFGYDVQETFNKFRGYGVFSNSLRNFSLGYGIKKVPSVIPLGINVEDYRYKKRSRLETLGYAQRYIREDTAQGFDIKRGNLTNVISSRTNLPIQYTGNIDGYVGLGLNDWFQEVDCLLVSSLIEGGPLAPFEGAASGIPTIGTPVGNYFEFALMGGGLLVDIEPDKYIHQTTQILNWWKQNPSAYEEQCLKSYELVKWYDWKHQSADWIEFFTKSLYL
ncbi:MAG: hypothetical protein VW683_00280 [Betaproteobacteria bacterium]|jgi:hypothetical protein